MSKKGGPSITSMHIAFGIASVLLLLFTVVATTLDNVLRPVLMTKGAKLPMLLMFTGVIGGLVAFGLIGVFVGPVVLAVSYTLLGAWIGTPSVANEIQQSQA